MANKTGKEDLKVVRSKLDIIISLLYDLKESFNHKSSIREKVSYFAKRGLSNKYIAKIIGISEKHVSKEKALSKKEKKGKNGREKAI